MYLNAAQSTLQRIVNNKHTQYIKKYNTIEKKVQYSTLCKKYVN